MAKPIDEVIREAESRGLRVIVDDSVETITKDDPEFGRVLVLRAGPRLTNVGQAEAKATE